MKVFSLSLMITFMSDLIIVTNRKLAGDDFLLRIEEICKCSPHAVILREKDLPEDEYTKLATDVKSICDRYNVTFISNTYIFGENNHLPLGIFSRKSGKIVGTSVHSVEDAVKAQELGADYVLAGHVFETDCKKGLPGRGLKFIEDVVSNISIPVYAIGGITPENYKDVIKAGAKGAAIMSSAMTCKNVREYFSAF